MKFSIVDCGTGNDSRFEVALHDCGPVVVDLPDEEVRAMLVDQANWEALQARLDVLWVAGVAEQARKSRELLEHYRRMSAIPVD